jgi:hypothetical protein
MSSPFCFLLAADCFLFNSSESFFISDAAFCWLFVAFFSLPFSKASLALFN